MWYLLDIPYEGEYRADLHSRLWADCGIAYETLPEGVMWKQIREGAGQSQPIQQSQQKHSSSVVEALNHWRVDPLAGWRERWV